MMQLWHVLIGREAEMTTHGLINDQNFKTIRYVAQLKQTKKKGNTNNRSSCNIDKHFLLPFKPIFKQRPRHQTK